MKRFCRFHYLVFILAWSLIGSGCTLVPLRSTPLPTTNAQEEALLNFFAGQSEDARGAFEPAAGYYRRAIQADPESATLRRCLVQDLVQLQRFSEALQAYEALAQRSPVDAKNHFALGQIHAAAGNTRQAEALFRQAIAAGTDGAKPLTQLGLLCLKQDRTSEGVVWLKQALDKDPLDREARQALVQYHLSQEQPQSAIRLLQTAYALMPDDLQWLAGLAGLLSEDPKRQAEAAQGFEKLVRLYPEYPEAHRFLAGYYIQMKRWSDASEQLEYLLKLEPESLWLQRNLALAWYHLRDLSRARDILLHLVQQDQADAFTHYLLGSVYQQKALLQLAADEFQKALRLDPGLPDVYVGLVQLLLQANDLDSAKTLLAKADQKFPGTPELMMMHGLVGLKQSKFQDALRWLRQAARAQPDNPRIFFHLGRVYQQLQDVPQAMRAWKKTIQLEPQDPEPYNYMAYTLAEQGKDLPQALIWIHQALALAPENGYYLDTLGWIYYQQGQLHQALEMLLKARSNLQATADDPTVYEHLGEVYVKLKNVPEARKAWSKALALDPRNTALQKKIETLPSLEVP